MRLRFLSTSSQFVLKNEVKVPVHLSQSVLSFTHFPRECSVREYWLEASCPNLGVIMVNFAGEINLGS